MQSKNWNRCSHLLTTPTQINFRNFFIKISKFSQNVTSFQNGPKLFFHWNPLWFELKFINKSSESLRRHVFFIWSEKNYKRRKYSSAFNPLEHAESIPVQRLLRGKKKKAEIFVVDLRALLCTQYGWHPPSSRSALRQYIGPILYFLLCIVDSCLFHFRHNWLHNSLGVLSGNIPQSFVSYS